MSDMNKITKASDYIKGLLQEKKDVKAQYEVSELVTKEISYENGDFSLFRTLFDNEVTIKVIADKKKGQTSTNSFDEAVLKETFENALLSAESGTADDCFDIAPKNEKEEFFLGDLEPDVDKLMQRAREFADDVEANFKNIMVMKMIFQHVRKDTLYRNTSGSEDTVHSGSYAFLFEYAGNDGKNTAGISFTQVEFKDLDTPLMELGRIRKDLEEAEQSIYPKPIEGKFEGKVIFTPACFKMGLYCCGGIALSDSVLIDKASLWSDKLGEKVASEKLNITVSPWDERIVEGEVYTEDGFRSKDFELITDGVLKSYFTTLYGANKAGVERALNTSKAIVVEPGEISFEEMIKSVDKGLLVGMISCGMPGVNGELSGVAKNAFYIENGEIKHAVSETMISFNVVKMLKDIVSLSKEVVCDGSSVIPYACVDHITISGK